MFHIPLEPQPQPPGPSPQISHPEETPDLLSRGAQWHSHELEPQPQPQTPDPNPPQNPYLLSGCFTMFIALGAGGAQRGAPQPPRCVRWAAAAQHERSAAAGQVRRVDVAHDEKDPPHQKGAWEQPPPPGPTDYPFVPEREQPCANKDWTLRDCGYLNWEVGGQGDGTSVGGGPRA